LEPVRLDHEGQRASGIGISTTAQGLILFTYLHLAANESVTRELRERKVTGIAYETIQLDDGSLPLLTPMSEIAGRLSIQVGAWCLQAENGGRGILLGGASGVRPGKVVILGAGMSGTAACQVAAGLGAYVNVLDIHPTKLRYVHDILGGHVTTLMSNRANVEEEVVDADLVIGSVLIPGAKAPKLISRFLVQRMKPGAAFVDISIDQGGCAETSRPTTHRQPIYVEEEVVHYCVTNMPASVPNTSTYALTNSTLSYGLEPANRGFPQALIRNEALAKGLNTYDGKITHEGVATAFNLPLTPVEEVIRQ
jgi:alanine dehydrogenase